MILDGSTGGILAFSPFKLERGRDYRVRAEVDGHYLRLLVDGRKLCEYRREFPFTSGYFGIYLFYSGKVVDDVAVFFRGGAELVPATKGGDALYRHGQYEDARTEYRTVEKSVNKPTLQEEARYKQALCLLQEDRDQAAYEILEGLEGTSVDTYVQRHLLQRDYANGRHQAALQRMRALYTDGNEQQRTTVHAMWEAFVGNMRRRGRLRELQPYLRMREDLFPQEPIHLLNVGFIQRSSGNHTANAADPRMPAPIAAGARMWLRRYEEVPQLFPELEQQAVDALVFLGRWQEAARRYPHQWQQSGAHHLYKSRQFDLVLEHFPKSMQAARVLLCRGQYKRILAEHPNQDKICAVALIRLGRYDEVLKRYPDNDRLCADALLAAGRWEELITKYPKDFDNHVAALLWLGRDEEILKLKRLFKPNRTWIFAHLGRMPLLQKRFSTKDPVCMRTLLDSGRFDQIFKNYAFSPRFRASALIAAGRASEIELATFGKNNWYAARLARGDTQGMLEELDLSVGNRAELLYRRGDYEAVAAGCRDIEFFTTCALLRLGRLEEARLEAASDIHCRLLVLQFAALEQAATGDIAAARRELDSISDVTAGFADDTQIFNHFLLPAFLAHLDGDKEVLHKRLQEVLAKHRGVFQQRLWHAAAVLAGKVDMKEFRQQPAKRWLPADEALYTLLKAEVDGDRQSARAAGQRYQQLPGHQRPVNPVVDRFIQWRLSGN